ncbi:MAG: ABC transporter substrate-binding protein [Actinomycetaceae bacterium]|nr:ABC transporter substrate-binding protein [Actinomycetaceae bacterium]
MTSAPHHRAHIKFLVPAVITSLALLAGCSDRPTQADQGGKGAPSASSKETRQTEPIELKDQRGATVTLDKPAEKVAMTVIPAPAIMSAIDQSWDKIVGINESTLKANKQGIITRIFPQADQTPVISDSSFAPNMETLLDLAPDLVIQWGDQGGDVLEPIEQAGLPVIGLKYGTHEDLETWIRLFSSAIGKPERGHEMIVRMDTEAAEISAQVSTLRGPKPRGLQLSYSAERLSVSNKKTYAQHIFDLAGVENMAADNATQDGAVNPEQLIAWDPEIIFISAFDPATPADVYADPRLHNISAVKNKRVYRTPLGVYRMQVPCAESAIMWHWAAALAHPGTYKVDLREKMRETEKFLYGYDVTDEDIDLTLRMDINAGSAHYDIFEK